MEKVTLQRWLSRRRLISFLQEGRVACPAYWGHHWNQSRSGWAPAVCVCGLTRGDKKILYTPARTRGHLRTMPALLFSSLFSLFVCIEGNCCCVKCPRWGFSGTVLLRAGDLAGMIGALLLGESVMGWIKWWFYPPITPCSWLTSTQVEGRKLTRVAAGGKKKGKRKV